MHRRNFIRSAAAAGGALSVGALPSSLRAASDSATAPDSASLHTRKEKAAESLSILIIGGTGFTGPEQVEHALARGHRVTIINRNQRRPDLFKGKVEQLVGDLSADMSALKGREFDAVLDIPTTYPYWV